MYYNLYGNISINYNEKYIKFKFNSLIKGLFLLSPIYLITSNTTNVKSKQIIDNNENIYKIKRLDFFIKNIELVNRKEIFIFLFN